MISGLYAGNPISVKEPCWRLITMRYTKKQYLLLGILFLFLSILCFIFTMASDGKDVLGSTLFNALWTLSTVIGCGMLIIGVFTNDDEYRSR